MNLIVGILKLNQLYIFKSKTINNILQIYEHFRNNQHFFKYIVSNEFTKCIQNLHHLVSNMNYVK